jgi:hypothetical protein
MYLRHILNEFASEGVSHEVLQSYAENAAIPASQLLDEVAAFIAKEYSAKRMSFAEADLIINNVWCLATGLDEEISRIIWAVYLAFDGGEYRRSGDGPEVDPELKYTVPAISAFLLQCPKL